MPRWRRRRAYRHRLRVRRLAELLRQKIRENLIKGDMTLIVGHALPRVVGDIVRKLKNAGMTK
jgi:hypothetical protein